jgi:hypothetical protein
MHIHVFAFTVNLIYIDVFAKRIVDSGAKWSESAAAIIEASQGQKPVSLAKVDALIAAGEALPFDLTKVCMFVCLCLNMNSV